MSQGKGRTPKTKAKRSCLSTTMQMEAERRAMKKALKKWLTKIFTNQAMLTDIYYLIRRSTQ